MYIKKKKRDSGIATVSYPLREVSKKSINTMSEYTDSFIEGAISTSDSGSFKTYSEQEIMDMLANPEDNQKELSDLMTFYYISDGDIYTLYSLFKSLPSLKYKVGAFDSTIKRYELSMSELTKSLHKVRYKELTRDIIGQVCSTGGVVTMWCGNKKAPFLYVFDQLDYVFPRYRVNGEWECVVDMAWFENMEEEERLSMFLNLSPYITESQFNAYKNNQSDKEKRYIPLPQDRTTYVRGDAIRRNQRLGTPCGTQALKSILHKQMLNDLEKSVSNRVMKNVGILTIGTKEEGKSFVDIDPLVVKEIKRSVGNALKQNTLTGATKIPVMSLPEFANIEFSKVDSLDALKSEKFDNVNREIASDTGVGSAFTSGDTGNYSTATVNKEYVYSRISMLLEQIEVIFEKMFKLILPKNVADNFYFEFDTTMPISSDSEVSILTQMMSMGWSPKALVDKVRGVNFDDYLEESLYFQSLGIYNQITPPMTAYTNAGDTQEGKEEVGNEEIQDPTNDNTIKSKTNDGNENPNVES